MSPIKSFALCGLIGIAIVGCGEPATTVKVPVVEPPMEPDSQPAVESHVEPSEESGVEPAERTVAEPTVAPVEPASGKPSGSRRAQLKVDYTEITIVRIKQAITMYRIKMARLPRQLKDLRDEPTDPALRAQWTTSLLEEIPADAWGNPIVYTITDGKYELRSAGVDGQISSDDDIVDSGP